MPLLSGRKRDVLVVLDNVGREMEHHEIAVKCGIEYCRAELLHPALRGLLSAGLVEVTGKQKAGGRLFRITADGKKALFHRFYEQAT